jgi:hypothetical protein
MRATAVSSFAIRHSSFVIRHFLIRPSAPIFLDIHHPFHPKISLTTFSSTLKEETPCEKKARF